MYKFDSTNDSALMSTCQVVLMFKVVMENGREYPLYINQNRNSHLGVKPLRLSYEKESPTSLETEGDRLYNEMSELHNTTFYPKSYPNIPVKFEGSVEFCLFFL